MSYRGYDELRRGLVLHLPLSEGAGTKVFDTSQYANCGTFNGDPTWVEGREGRRALEFDGVGDSITLTPITIPDAITIMGWLRWTAPDETVESNSWPVNGDTYSLASKWGTHHLIARIESDTTSYETGILYMPDNLWHQVGMIYDKVDGILRLFMDTIQQKTKDVGVGKTIDAPAHLTMGGTGPGTAIRALELADVYIYNRALDPIEIRNLYNLRGLI